jgi:hypothetical protein
MKKLCLMVACLGVAGLMTGQVCLKMKQGQKLKTTGNRYNNDEVFNPSYGSMKESKRDQKVAEFNKKVLAGEVPPIGGTYVYDLKKVDIAPNQERALLATEIGGKKYESIIACIRDTMYFTRITGVSYMVDAKGDTIGLGILGVQAIPNNIKVGDKLQPFEDVGFLVPEAKTYTAKHNIFKGYENSVRTYRDFGYDPAHGWGPGNTTVHETKAIYESIDVNVRETTKFTSTTVNYAVAEVKAEEEVTVDGVKYKAFRIESQTWIKPKLERTYESNNQEWVAGRKEADEKVKVAMEERGIKKGYLNKFGYTVSYRTEWFVPGMGVAKMYIYDNFGNILAVSQLESIK